MVAGARHVAGRTPLPDHTTSRHLPAYPHMLCSACQQIGPAPPPQHTQADHLCQLLQAMLRQNVAARWHRTAGSDPLTLRAVIILHMQCHRIWQQASETCSGLSKLWYQYGLTGITAASFGALLHVLLQPALQQDVPDFARQLRLLAEAMCEAHATQLKVATVAVICCSMLLGSKVLMQQLSGRLAAPGALQDAVL